MQVSSVDYQHLVANSEKQLEYRSSRTNFACQCVENLAVMNHRTESQDDDDVCTETVRLCYYLVYTAC
jgi:hypothetical protein